MKMKNLKAKIQELPDDWQVTKVHVETVNTKGYIQTIEFEMLKNKLILKEVKNDVQN